MKSSGKACCLITIGLAILLVGAFSVLAVLVWHFQINPLAWLSGANQSSTSTSRVIVATQGGRLGLADDTQVDVPPNALESDASVHITILPTQPEGILVPQDSPVIFREINASGVALKQPVKLTFSYASLETQSSLDPDMLFVARWENGQWVYLGGEVDAQRKTITVDTEHFSIFGIFSLPSLDTLLAELRDYLSKCNLPPITQQDNQLTQLVNQIGQVNAAKLPSPMPKLNVYLSPGLNNFSGPPSPKEGCAYILADKDWFEGRAAWLPKDKRNLLAEAILAHELSHILRGKTTYDAMTDALKQMARSEGDAFVKKKLGKYWADLWFALLKGDFLAVVNANSELWNAVSENIGQAIAPDTCPNLQQLELAADADAANWVSNYVGDANAVGLIFARYFQNAGSAGSCDHPSGTTRAQQIRTGLAMGPNGGIFGKVTGANAEALREVDMTLDDKSVGKSDENGQFLFTGLLVGKHTMKYSKTGYQSGTSTIDVPSKDLIDSSFVLSTASNVALPTKTLSLIPTPTTQTGRPTPPVLQPNGRIAFALDDSNIQQSLNIVNADGTGAKKLLYGRIYLNTPCWSPDGQKIAFSSNRDSPMPESSLWATELFDIYVINIDGTGLRRLTTDTDLNNCRGWSADGRYILVEAGRKSNSRRVYVIDSVTGTKRKISVGEENSGGSRFSPDGKRIAYGGDQALYVVNVDGTGLRELFNPIYSHTSPRSAEWSPDGTMIAFQSNGVHTILLDGSGQKDWKDGYVEPVWRPGGKELGMLWFTFDSFKLDGTLVHSTDLQTWSGFSWSPDGNFLLAKNGHESYSEFQIVSAYPTSPEPIVRMKGRDPAWFPPPSPPTSNPTRPPSTAISTPKSSSYSSSDDFVRLVKSIGSRNGLTVVDAGIYNTVAQVTFTRETNRSDGLFIIQSMTQVFRELVPEVFDNMPSVMGVDLRVMADFRDPNGKIVSMNGMMILAITRRTAGSLDWKTYRSQDLDKILFAGEDPLKQGNIFHIDPAWQSAWVMFQHQ